MIVDIIYIISDASPALPGVLRTVTLKYDAVKLLRNKLPVAGSSIEFICAMTCLAYSSLATASCDTAADEYRLRAKVVWYLPSRPKQKQNLTPSTYDSSIVKVIYRVIV